MHGKCPFTTSIDNKGLEKVTIADPSLQSLPHPYAHICWTNQIPTGTVVVVDTVLQL